MSTCFLCFHFCDEFRDDHAHAYQRPTGWCVRYWTPCFQCLLSRVTFAQIFLKLAPSCDFETSSRAVKTTVSTSRQIKVAPYSFLTARELVLKSRDGASFKKSTRKSRVTSTTASNSHRSSFSNHRCLFPMC